MTNPEPRPGSHHLRKLRVAVVLSRFVECSASGAPNVDSDDVYFGPVLRGVQAGLAAKAVEIVYRPAHGREYLQYMREEGLDGLIFLTPEVNDLPLLYGLLQESAPFVALGVSSRTQEHRILPCVDADNVGGAREGVQHLLKLGHTQIGCINFAADFANHADRLDGYCEALRQVDIALESDLMVLKPGYDPATFEAEIDRWLVRMLATGKLPTGLFVSDFATAQSAFAVLKNRGITVPGQVSVVGFDDPWQVARFDPPLTAIRQPVYGLGLRAAQRLLEALSRPGYGRAVVGTEFLNTKLVVRASTAPPRIVG